MRNVLNSVIDNKMCMRCGGCVAVCPKHVLKISYNNKTGFFDIKEDKPSCIECGLCMTVCPALKKEYSGSPIGPYKDLCLTFSCNAHVRGNGTSGGVVNELCQLLLETKIVDSVLLVKNSPKNRVWTEPIWIESAEYLKKTPRDFASRYISVPVCSLLQKREKNKKYAIVGTPCQIHSAKKILGKNHFFIGIACSEGISFKATEQYLKCIGKKAQILCIIAEMDGLEKQLFIVKKRLFRNRNTIYLILMLFIHLKYIEIEGVVFAMINLQKKQILVFLIFGILKK